jgi:hypothetical protein
MSKGADTIAMNAIAGLGMVLGFQSHRLRRSCRLVPFVESGRVKWTPKMGPRAKV